MYKLAHLIDVMESTTSKEAWRNVVDEAIHKLWKELIEKEAESKSSICFLNKSFISRKSHLIWGATSTCPWDVRWAMIKARLLSGSYILQCNRAIFNQTHNTTCPLCRAEEEDTVHFLIMCTALKDVRKPSMEALLQQIPLVYSQNPESGSEPPILAHASPHPCCYHGSLAPP